jgi:exopolysaccharide biosynthesis polyprenyl glycosylphosphotransferase
MGRYGAPVKTTAKELQSDAVREPGRAVHPLDGRRAEAPWIGLRGYVLRRAFVGSDLIALGCAVGGTYAVKALAGRPVVIDDVWLVALFLPLWVPIGIVTGLYHLDAAGRGLRVNTADEVGPVFRTATVWAWCLLLAWLAVHSGYLELLPLVAIWALGIPLVIGFRALTRYLVRTSGWYTQAAVLVGRPADRVRLLSRIERHSEWGIRVVEQFDSPHVAVSPGAPSGAELTAQAGNLGNGPEGAVSEAERFLDVVTSRGANRVIFATPPGDLEEHSELVCNLAHAGFAVDFVAADSDILSSASQPSRLEGLPVLSVSPGEPPRAWRFIKRALDLSIAVPALLLALPLLAYCVLRIKLNSPGPALFGQKRVGRDGRHFRFLKLRTMSPDAEERKAEVAALNIHGGGLDIGNFKAINDPRVTKVGAWLRRYSLDELPQLWNVVRGDMSLVGPRPLPVVEDARIPSRYELRRLMRPGMTGPWQVLGRSDIPYNEMLKLDYSYVLNWSAVDDLKLLFQTVGAVVRGRGAY